MIDLSHYLNALVSGAVFGFGFALGDLLFKKLVDVVTYLRQ